MEVGVNEDNHFLFSALAVMAVGAVAFGTSVAYNSYNQVPHSDLLLDGCIDAQAQNYEPEDYVYELYVSRCYLTGLTSHFEYGTACPLCMNHAGEYCSCAHGNNFLVWSSYTYEGTTGECRHGRDLVQCDSRNEYDCR